MAKTAFINNLYFLLSFFLLTAGIVALPFNLDLAAVSLNPYLFNQLDLTSFHKISNLFYNTFHIWSFTPALSRFLFWIEPSLQPIVSLLFHLLFLVSGLYALCSYLVKNEKVISLTVSVNFIIIFFVLFKFDIVLISAISFLPLYIYSFMLAGETNSSGRLFKILLLTTSSYLLITSANQLCLLFILLPLLYREFKTSGWIYKSAIVLSSSVGLIWFSLYPAASFPDYPPTARVVAEDEVPGNSRPVLGPDSPIQFQNLEIQREAFYWPAVLFAAIALFLFLERRQCRTRTIILILALCLLADCFFPDYIAHILPLETFSRLVPNLFYFSTISISAALLIFLLLIELLKSRKLYFINFMFLGVLLLANAGKNFTFTESKNVKLLERIYSLNFDSKFFYNANLFNIINSPSAAVLLDYGGSEIESVYQMTKLKFRSVTSLLPSAITSHKDIPSLKQHLFNREEEIRWTSGGGIQRGTESIKIRFETPAWFQAIELATGPSGMTGYFTDFPRGLKILAAPSCDSVDISDYKLLAEYPQWKGSIKFTSDNFPFFSHESLVKIYLPQPQKIQCLAIYQTGKTDKSDWSVTEIKGLYSSSPRDIINKALSS
jgi:hypothetical protein